MITDKKIIKYIMTLVAVWAMTACGGDGGNSGSCSPRYTDSDGDGFHDGIDKAPHDASIPGDFSTPEKILADPEVKRVLKLAKERGVAVRTELGKNPPNLTGYYKREAGGHAIKEFSSGGLYVPSEARICTTNDRFEVSTSQFSAVDGRVSTPYYYKNLMFRGDKNSYTSYFLIIENCGNNTTSYGVKISSGKLDSNGDIINRKSVNINLAIVGPAKAQCQVWSAVNFSTYHKVTDLDEFEYMCVDGKKAYAPKETWTNSDKESCRCTMDIEIECS